MDRKYLDHLKRLGTNSNRAIPPWLEDFILQGPRLEEWPRPETKPNRMFLTEFLARWLKFAGLSKDECLEWLLPYCCEVLQVYSKSGPSAIRHGTKSNTRWVYDSAFPFDFETMVQHPPPPEFEGRPPWMPVFEHWQRLLPEMKAQAMLEYRARAPLFVAPVPVKQRFAEQFAKAEALARQRKIEGMKPEEIVVWLNEQGFLTRTGRPWTLGTVNRVIAGYRRSNAVPTCRPTDKTAEPGP